MERNYIRIYKSHSVFLFVQTQRENGLFEQRTKILALLFYSSICSSLHCIHFRKPFNFPRWKTFEKKNSNIMQTNTNDPMEELIVGYREEGLVLSERAQKFEFLK